MTNLWWQQQSALCQEMWCHLLLTFSCFLYCSTTDVMTVSTKNQPSLLQSIKQKFNRIKGHNLFCRKMLLNRVAVTVVRRSLVCSLTRADGTNSVSFCRRWEVAKLWPHWIHVYKLVLPSWFCVLIIDPIAIENAIDNDVYPSHPVLSRPVAITNGIGRLLFVGTIATARWQTAFENTWNWNSAQ